MPHRDARAHVHFRTCPIATRRLLSTFGYAPSRRAGPCPLSDMPYRDAKTPDRVSLKIDPIRSSHKKLRVHDVINLEGFPTSVDAVRGA